MNPVISIGIYAAIQIAIMLSIVRAIRNSGASGRSGNKAAAFLAAAVFLAAASLPVFGTLLPNGEMKNFCQAAGNLVLGFLMYFEAIFCLVSLVCVALGAAGKRSRRHLSGVILLCSAAGAAVVFVLGLIHAQQPKIRRYEIELEKSAGDLEGLKVVLLADLHMGVNSRPETMRRVTEMVNAEKPDLILIAGDFFTSTYEGLKNPELYAEALRTLSAPEGVYGVYGNHDVAEDLFGGFPVTPISMAFRPDEMERFIEGCGIRILEDEVVPVCGGSVLLAGRVDGEKAGDGSTNRMRAAELLSGADLTKPVLVLEHEPKDFAALKEAGADLAMCGHTHNGQMFPGNLLVGFFNENAYGLKKVAGLDTVVTSGVGYYGPPLRVGTDSEITVLDLRFRSPGP